MDGGLSSSVHHIRRYIMSVNGHFKCDHLVKVVCVGFLYCQIISFILLLLLYKEILGDNVNILFSNRPVGVNIH